MRWWAGSLTISPARAFPYHLFGWLARALRLHPFVQHDGPVSIARAFQPADWRELCARAGLREDEVAIRAWMPARSVRKPEQSMTVAAQHECLVIGGGLAGSMAALRLARAGRPVLLVEREPRRHAKSAASFCRRKPWPICATRALIRWRWARPASAGCGC